MDTQHTLNTNIPEIIEEEEFTFPINPKDYSDKPDELFPHIRTLSEEKRDYETALELLNIAIKYKLQLIDDDRNNIQMVKYYMEYADILIQKQMNSEDLLNIGNKEEKPKQVVSKKHEDDNDKSDDENEDEDDEEEASDGEIIYDNLFTAQKILQKEISNSTDEDKSKLKYDLSRVFVLFSENEMSKSDYQAAINYLQTALELRKESEDKFSRRIAEVYYQMGMCYDFDAQKSFNCFYRAKIILEYHLQKAADENNQKVVYYNNEEDLLNSNTNIDPDKIIINIEAMKPSIFDSDKVKDLKSILEEVYLKVSLI